jgi:hypothetical protein
MIQDICHSWLRFEREFGSLEDFDHAVQKVNSFLLQFQFDCLYTKLAPCLYFVSDTYEWFSEIQICRIMCCSFQSWMSRLSLINHNFLILSSSNKTFLTSAGCIVRFLYSLGYIFFFWTGMFCKMDPVLCVGSFEVGQYLKWT